MAFIRQPPFKFWSTAHHTRHLSPEQKGECKLVVIGDMNVTLLSLRIFSHFSSALKA
jgi:hypothetical protein